jgi:hypothetical protein
MQVLLLLGPHRLKLPHTEVQNAIVQAPFLHVLPSPQRFPHMPQLFASVLRLVQVPSQSSTNGAPQDVEFDVGEALGKPGLLLVLFTESGVDSTRVSVSMPVGNGRVVTTTTGVVSWVGDGFPPQGVETTSTVEERFDAVKAE